MTIMPDEQGCYTLSGSIPLDEIEALAKFGTIERLSINKTPLMTVQLAQRLEALRVEHVWLWCRVTARAMRHVIRIPALRVLDVLHIQDSGRLQDFRYARQLEVLRANHGLSADDLCQISQCPGLRQLGAQGADITRASLSAVLSMTALEAIDLEATRFDDAMARQLSRSTTITSLDLGSTRLTRHGLAQLVGMSQLRSLDLWATDISHADLSLLRELPNLEYVSLGHPYPTNLLDPAAVTDLLLELPNLKRAWLDGVGLDAKQHASLSAKLESVRVTEND
jgi:hypothetical protein